MSRFLDELSKVCGSSYHAAVSLPFLKYVTKGDVAALQQAKKQGDEYFWWLSGVWAHLSGPNDLSEEEKRAMHAAAQLGATEELSDWALGARGKEPNEEEAYLEAYLKAFGSAAADRVQAAVALVNRRSDVTQPGDGEPRGVTRFLLSLSDAELKTTVSACEHQNGLLQLLLQRAPRRVPALAKAFLIRSSKYGNYIDVDACQLLLTHDVAHYECEVAGAFRAEVGLGTRFNAGVLLTRVNAQKYQQETRLLAREMLTDFNWAGYGEDVCKWLIEQYGQEALEEICEYLRHHNNDYCTVLVLRNTVAAFGRRARPAVLAALDNPKPDLRLPALEQLMEWQDDGDCGLIQSGFERGFLDTDGKVIQFLVLATKWNLALLQDSVWKLLQHKSKPVRQATARTLGRLGESAIGKAVELLAAKKADVRSAAVILLSVAQTPAAEKALDTRLDEESDEEVRDQILLALDAVWEATGKQVTRAQVEDRIERAAKNLKVPVTTWLDEKRLPPISFLKKSEKLSPPAIRYLLYRQSRAKEMQPDVEAKPLYGMIDHKTSGDFALALVQMFCRSKMAAEDRWALATAGLLGDDRLVPALMQQIRAWVDTNRGKMAEYAAEALALLGTDVALCAVDSLSIRYRSKQKNIGKAASEAFATAAERLGVTVDELGDRVVPWLGFEPGKPRLIEYGDKRIEVRIGPDFKIELRDVAKGKKVGSLPAGFPAESKNELKDLSTTLREVIKGQLVRLENLMVRQFRWPVVRWREMFLVHPVLFPFATRLVWGLYGADARLKSAFRALEDRSLTTEKDETVELKREDSGGATIGIIHPLELSPEQRQAWRTHLVDYNVESPFLQLERPVVYPAAEEQDVKISSKYRGKEVNAMTFKGRAERLGWQRGSVVDGGGISSYRKCFPGAGADVILGLDGMYIGIDMYSSIKLERFCFVNSGSVSVGSYLYDEPDKDNDERLLPFAEVPPIVFSETLGDLARIAGTTDGSSDERV